MSDKAQLAIIGTGNIGRAMAVGLASAGRFPREEMILTRRRLDRLEDLAAEGFQAQTDNRDAVRRAEVVVLAVEPRQLDPVLEEIRPSLDPDRHLLISVVSGAALSDLLRLTGASLSVVRAMPNTGIAVGRSMTCVAMNSDDEELRRRVVSIFDAVGRTLIIDEELMTPATALCACGIAFFLRAVRAAAQGGIEIGFHPEEALLMAAQTAAGAANLILEKARHPEHEIDSVTTPRGCTIAGLNEMEHQGFSSAMIKGITTSSLKASSLYSASGD
ncbi:MAG: pyrroline-5-carboxylate reductase [Myxococcales bacterium]|nr:MAG: pyrroline-5-carboxylate reductase [Myxococcales bacterium]